MMKIDFSTRFLSYCVHFCNSAKDPSPIRYQSQIFQPFRYSLRIHDLLKKKDRTKASLLGLPYKNQGTPALLHLPNCKISM